MGKYSNEVLLLGNLKEIIWKTMHPELSRHEKFEKGKSSLESHCSLYEEDKWWTARINRALETQRQFLSFNSGYI